MFLDSYGSVCDDEKRLLYPEFKAKQELEDFVFSRSQGVFVALKYGVSVMIIKSQLGLLKIEAN